MEYVEGLENTNIFIYIIKTFSISVLIFRTFEKNIGNNISNKRKAISFVGITVISIICGFIKSSSDFLSSIMFLLIFLSIFFSINLRQSIAKSLILTMMSLSINYSIFIIATAISFFPNFLLNINNYYISLLIILIIYFSIYSSVSRIKKLKKGFSFLQKNLYNEYFELLILNISAVVLFSIIILANYNQIATRNLGTGFIIICIIMLITIYESFNKYYKQKLLIQELNETKNELENKKKEIEELEKENLNFSKTSHSIAHKQKALEYKLNELMLKNEISEEIDLKKRINAISKEISERKTEIELSKTDISEIDNMLKYMQSECIKNKIDFQLQINGNIYYMINNYISKEELEILLADHIKNAIIAINNCENINKSILVRLGEIDGIYGVYVYDSGIEFEKDILINLGKKPVTTHANNGGTGMGFMNTFDTLNKYSASITIEEYNKPCKEDFTKLIKVEFDNKNEYTIVSYRYEEIKENCEKSIDISLKKW